MTEGIHPAAAHHLPSFITPPGDTDVLMVIMGLFLLAIILAIGLFYFKLHAIPEHVSHKANKVQFEIVAVLSLLALFTHNNFFWIAALLLALVTIPDFSGPINSMAASLRSLALRDGRQLEEPVSVASDEPQSGTGRDREH